jgi:hypothetical protein
VVAGESREDAAAMFGTAHDHAFVTSYADLDAEVDLGTIESLDLVPGVGLGVTLSAVSGRPGGWQGLTVRVAAPREHATSLAADLDAAAVGITGVQVLGEHVVLVVEPHPGLEAANRLVLSALESAYAVRPKNPVAPSVTPQDPAPAADAPRRERPEPRLVAMLGQVHRWRRGPRRRWAVITAAVLVLVLLAAIGAYDIDSLVGVGILLLVVLIVGATALVGYWVLLLSRQLHVQTGRIERMLLRNRDIVKDRTTKLSRQQRNLEQGQSRLPFLEEYVEAIAETTSASAARVRELVAELTPVEPAARDDPEDGPGGHHDYTVERSRPSQ